MTLGEVGFLKARGYPEPGNGVPRLAQDLIYNLQPLQVESVSQNHCNLEFPGISKIHPRSTKLPSMVKYVLKKTVIKAKMIKMQEKIAEK